MSAPKLPIADLLAIHLATCGYPAGHACGHMFILNGPERIYNGECTALPTAEWMREQKARITAERAVVEIQHAIGSDAEMVECLEIVPLTVEAIAGEAA